MVQTPRVQVHFVPRRQAHFAGSRRRQHQELERILRGDRGLGGSHGREGVCHRAVGQRPHVLDDGLLPPEGLPEGIARRVIRPVAHGDRPFHHGGDPLPYPPRGLGLVVPDRSEDGQDVGRGHLGHGQRPDARERIGAQTARPGVPVPRSTLKNPVVFRSDRTRFVGRLEPSEIERNPVLDLAP